MEEWKVMDGAEAVTKAFKLEGSEPASQPENEQRKRRFRFVDDVSLENLPDPEWLIDRILPVGALAVIYGPSGVYKSFMTTDWSLSIATGQPWASHEVRQGPVIYVAAEGVNGYKLRIRSWKDEHAFVGRAGVHYVQEAVQLHNEVEVASFIADMQEDGIRPALVVFDTLARCFVGGQENDAGAMGMVVESGEKIRRITGATVVIVHHSNKTDRIERGSNALRSNVDVVMAATKTGKGGRMKLECKKMKDSAEFDEMHFQFKVRGQSGVLVPMEAPKKEVTPFPDLNSRDRLALEALAESGLRYGQWRTQAIAAGVKGGTFQKIRERLLELGYVVQDAEGVYRRSEEDASDSIGSIPPRSGGYRDTDGGTLAAETSQ